MHMNVPGQGSELNGGPVICVVSVVIFLNTEYCGHLLAIKKKSPFHKFITDIINMKEKLNYHFIIN